MRLSLALGMMVILVILEAAGAAAQTGIPFNQRDDQYVLLGLKRAKEIYEVSRDELKRAEKLFEAGMASQATVDIARRAFADAEVNYQQSMLAVLFEQQYVAVTAAVKYQAADGGKHVRLVIENTSRGGEELNQLVASGEELLRSLRTDIVHNVYVSLLNGDNAIISQPYEAKVAALTYGQPVTIDFALLQDLDEVTVNLLYGNGSTRAVKIYLQKDASVDRVLVQSEQFSQEAELGGTATFGLELELFSGSSDTFRLEVVNLPAAINRYFVDPVNQARLRQVRFAESSRTRRAGLQVFLPDRPTDEIPMDRAISFYVLAIPQERHDEVPTLADHDWSEQELEELGIGYTRLELVPRGVGRLLVRAPQLYHTTYPGEAAEVTLDVVNEGTRPLDNVEVKADPPPGWEKVIEPDVIPVIGVAAESSVRLHFVPPEDTPVGKYEIRIRTSSFADESPITAEDKTLTVSVLARTSIAAPTILITLLLAIITAVVMVGIRIARR